MRIADVRTWSSIISLVTVSSSSSEVTRCIYTLIAIDSVAPSDAPLVVEFAIEDVVLNHDSDGGSAPQRTNVEFESVCTAPAHCETKNARVASR